MSVVYYVYKDNIGYHNIQCIENLSADKNQDGELSASELTSPAEKAFKVLDQNTIAQRTRKFLSAFVESTASRSLSLSLNGGVQLQIRPQHRHNVSTASGASVISYHITISKHGVVISQSHINQVSITSMSEPVS